MSAKHLWSPGRPKKEEPSVSVVNGALRINWSADPDLLQEVLRLFSELHTKASPGPKNGGQATPKRRLGEEHVKRGKFAVSGKLFLSHVLPPLCDYEPRLKDADPNEVKEKVMGKLYSIRTQHREWRRKATATGAGRQESLKPSLAVELFDQFFRDSSVLTEPDILVTEGLDHIIPEDEAASGASAAGQAPQPSPDVCAAAAACSGSAPDAGGLPPPASRGSTSRSPGPSSWVDVSKSTFDSGADSTGTGGPSSEGGAPVNVKQEAAAHSGRTRRRDRQLDLFFEQCTDRFAKSDRLYSLLEAYLAREMGLPSLASEEPPSKRRRAEEAPSQPCSVKLERYLDEEEEEDAPGPARQPRPAVRSDNARPSPSGQGGAELDTTQTQASTEPDSGADPQPQPAAAPLCKGKGKVWYPVPAVKHVELADLSDEEGDPLGQEASGDKENQGSQEL
jgi:hypothetical protein